MYGVVIPWELLDVGGCYSLGVDLIGGCYSLWLLQKGAITPWGCYM